MFKICSPSINEIFSQLHSSENGLTNDEAAQRLLKQTAGSKTESRISREFKLFIRQFTSPLVLLLSVAVILSGVLGETSDMLIILFILLATGLLSFFQELNAGRAVEKLQQMIHPVATVMRDGKSIEIKTNEIVSGDVLLFTAGDIIPADCRIIESNQLIVNESSLTGESYPVEKKPGEADENAPLTSKNNCLWKGTNIVNGTAKTIVVNLGKDSLFGHMQKSLQHETETVFEKGIKNFGYFLLRITLALAIVILGINLLFHRPIIDSVLFSLAIAVGMAPELLPAIMTLSMTAGARRMLKKKVIVKKLSSIFNLGEINILCTDKTGTITEGSVIVKEFVTGEGKADENLKLLASLNASLQSGFSNPIDDAIKKMNTDISGYEKLGEIPYDFLRKRLSVLVKKDSRSVLITKGAFANVLSVCDRFEANGVISNIDELKKTEFEKKFKDYSESGLRVLAISKKDVNSPSVKKEDEEQMVFAGFILLEDPLKKDVQQSIEKLKQLNVEIKIITGDNHYIAAYAARQLGMDDSKIITGSMLAEISQDALPVKACEANVFAEIEPNQKETIIRALQKAGKAVAYMGDGINDAAAIHAADTGISVEDAVDVAKEAADFVLMEKDLGVLADGIDEGRKSFANSMKYILINTGATFGNMFSLAGASLLLPFLPMLPKQILLTNFLTDFPYLAIASDNIDKEQMEKPAKWNFKTIRSFMIVFGIHSSIFDFITFFVIYFYFKSNEAGFQTSWFIESVMTELVILFIIRTRKSFIKSKPGNLLIIITVIAAVVTILITLPPVAPLLNFSFPQSRQLIAIVIILLLYVITGDLLKVYFFRKVNI